MVPEMVSQAESSHSGSKGQAVLGWASSLTSCSVQALFSWPSESFLLLPTKNPHYFQRTHSLPLSGCTVVHLVMAVWDVLILAITDGVEINILTCPSLCICVRSKTALAPWNPHFLPKPGVSAFPGGRKNSLGSVEEVGSCPHCQNTVDTRCSLQRLSRVRISFLSL